MSAFEEVGLCPELIRAVDELGWLLPTPVQAEAVPLILGKHSIWLYDEPLIAEGARCVDADEYWIQIKPWFLETFLETQVVAM